MILKESCLIPADKCGVDLVKTFHLYRGFNRRCSYCGDFIKISVRRTAPNNWVKKKTKIKGIIVRSAYSNSRLDGINFRFKENNLVLLKKRLTTKGKEIVGPVVRSIKRKKFVNAFIGSI